MEIYPSIERTIIKTPIIAFDKIDGSNIRVEWNRKSGFSKFGTRKRLLDPNESVLGEAVELFNEKYSQDLEQIFRKKKLQRATAFLEFAGANSFAGQHEEEDHDITLIDLHVYKMGMLTGKEFLNWFGNLDIPGVLYQGTPNEKFIESVRNSTLKNMGFEGVVCRGGIDNRQRPMSFKIKTNAWLDSVKAKYGNDPKTLEYVL